MFNNLRFEIKKMFYFDLLTRKTGHVVASPGNLYLNRKSIKLSSILKNKLSRMPYDVLMIQNKFSGGVKVLLICVRFLAASPNKMRSRTLLSF